MNSRPEKYEFCPECGALMENGICKKCEKEKGVFSSGFQPEIIPEDSQNPQNFQEKQDEKEKKKAEPPVIRSPYSPYPPQQEKYPKQPPYMGMNGYPPYYNYNNPYQMPPGKPPMPTSTKILIGVGAGIGIFFLILNLIFFGILLIRSAMAPAGQGNGEAPVSKELPLPEDRNAEDGTEEQPEDKYVPSPEDEYYEGLADSINEDVNYSFERKAYENEDPDHDIDIIINYVLLKGEAVPNRDKLNEAIEKVSLYYAEEFPKNSMYAEYGKSYQVYITPYVTYNDNDIVSIVLDEYVSMDGVYMTDLYPINIDMKNGVILDNESILQIDGAFAKEFRKRSNQQNGKVEGLDQMDDEQVQQFLKEKQTVIAYYTPLGMEVGFNYNLSGNAGWLTVTYKDYKDFLTKF